MKMTNLMTKEENARYVTNAYTKVMYVFTYYAIVRVICVHINLR